MLIDALCLAVFRRSEVRLQAWILIDAVSSAVFRRSEVRLQAHPSGDRGQRVPATTPGPEEPQPQHPLPRHVVQGVVLERKLIVVLMWYKVWY